MRLDLRIPMGMMFTLTGMILTVFGMKTRGDSSIYANSLGIDANLWWGIVLLVFGLVVLFIGERRQYQLAKRTGTRD